MQNKISQRLRDPLNILFVIPLFGINKPIVVFLTCISANVPLSSE